MSALADQSVALGWNQSSDPTVVGYRIYYGNASRHYTNAVTLGNVTNATIGGLTANTTYYFAATSYTGQNVESSLSVEATYTVSAAVAVSPIPLVLPTTANLVAAQSVVIGQNVSFAAAVPGTGAFTYQWKFNSSSIASATNAVLNLSGVTAAQAGTYTLVVTGSNGFTTNLAASLTIYPTAAATLTPVAYAGGQYAFTVAGVSGSQYVVQTSTNLVNWNSVQTNTAPFTFLDANAGRFNQGYYRTLSLFGGSAASNSVSATNAANVGLTVSANTAASLTQPAFANGQYAFTVVGTTGDQYVVQASTNLVDWVSLATNTPPFQFVDSAAGQFKQRFYRTF